MVSSKEPCCPKHTKSAQRSKGRIEHESAALYWLQIVYPWHEKIKMRRYQYLAFANDDWWYVYWEKISYMYWYMVTHGCWRLNILEVAWINWKLMTSNLQYLCLRTKWWMFNFYSFGVDFWWFLVKLATNLIFTRSWYCLKMHSCYWSQTSIQHWL